MRNVPADQGFHLRRNGKSPILEQGKIFRGRRTWFFSSPWAQLDDQHTFFEAQAMAFCKALFQAFCLALQMPLGSALRMPELQSMFSTRCKSLRYTDLMASFPGGALFKTHGVQEEVGDTTDQTAFRGHRMAIRCRGFALCRGARLG